MFGIRNYNYITMIMIVTAIIITVIMYSSIATNVYTIVGDLNAP